MKLWIDDIRQIPDDSWTLARTLGEAIRAIHMFAPMITEISIDHDISHYDVMKQEEMTCRETFAPVCYYIGEIYRHFSDSLSEDSPPKITLHTANETGALEMQRILKEYNLDSTINPATSHG